LNILSDNKVAQGMISFAFFKNSSSLVKMVQVPPPPIAAEKCQSIF
jgi:hypothetical protein